MRRLSFVLLLGVVLALMLPNVVLACPSCSEAVPANSGTEAEDQARLSRAYNNSIYLMAGMPYVLLGTVGYLVYRRLRFADPAHTIQEPAQSLPHREEPRSALPGDRACSLPSRDDAS